MRDFVGRQLEVGDLVAANYGSHPTFHLFEVVSGTEQKVRLIKADRQPIYANGKQLRSGDTILKFFSDVSLVAQVADKAEYLDQS
jgi:hypothetical protein